MPINQSVHLGSRVVIRHPDLVNVYGCRIGDETQVGPFVEVQAGVTVGARCKIQSHAFICSGVTLEDEVFVGHGVMFTNDRYPRAAGADGRLLGADDWTLEKTHVGRGASIGSGAVVLPVRIGTRALVAAGAVVTRDVADHTIVAGNPARVVGDVRDREQAGLPA